MRTLDFTSATRTTRKSTYVVSVTRMNGTRQKYLVNATSGEAAVMVATKQLHKVAIDRIRASLFDAGKWNAGVATA